MGTAGAICCLPVNEQIQEEGGKREPCGAELEAALPLSSYSHFPTASAAWVGVFSHLQPKTFSDTNC